MPLPVLAPRLSDRLFGVRRRAASWMSPAPQISSRWMVSECGWRLHSRVVCPPRGLDRPLPALLVIPDHQDAADALFRWFSPIDPRDLARLGVLVMVLDLSGRGDSWGSEDFGGPQHQADVRIALRTLAQHPQIEAERIGCMSLGLGACALGGALAADNRPPVSFWLDYEGPASRENMRLPLPSKMCDELRWWQEREPVRFISQIDVPYLRYQSSHDHVLGETTRHAEQMVSAACMVQHRSVHLNHHPRGIPSHPKWAPSGTEAANRWIITQIRRAFRVS